MQHIRNGSVRGSIYSKRQIFLSFTGGVKNGSSAQEESLCRCSALFPTIDRKWLYEKYYAANRQARDNRHTDACICPPGVIICKTDESIPQRMQEKDFVTVDVISCAAANQVDILILGAFGCGAFPNDPDTVAKAYRTALKEYRDKFDRIVFAIYCSGTDRSNFDAFENRIGSF